MSTIDDLEERNAVFAREAFSPKDSLMPTLRTIVISCVDPRVDPAHVLGLGDGEALVIRNVGGRVSPAAIETLAMLGAVARGAGTPPGPGWKVYKSEAATNDRNRGIAHLLDGYGRMYCDPNLATDVYTRQCSLLVSARDLAVMGATLANGGVNPVTGEQAIDTRYCKRVLAVLVTAGLYEHSGEWLARYSHWIASRAVAAGRVTSWP